MTKLTTISRLACLTTVLAASVALITTVDIANAKGNSNHGDNAHSNGATSRFAANGQSHGEKRMSDHQNNKKEKHAKKKKDCEKIIVPTPGCAISPKDPVGSVHTGGITGGNKSPAPPSQTAGGTSTKGPSPGATTVTLSNGVTSSAIENGKGITVTSNSPGMITVSNGNGSVTMPGGSVTLHGALSVSVPPGMQLVHLTNGDVSVAVGPILSSGNSKSTPVPGGVGLKDDLKFVGNGLVGTVGAPVVSVAVAASVPGALIGAITDGERHPLSAVGKYIAETEEKALDWVTSFF